MTDSAADNSENKSNMKHDSQSLFGRTFGRFMHPSKAIAQQTNNRQLGCSCAERAGRSRHEGQLLASEQALTEAIKTLSAVATAVWRAKTKLDQEKTVDLPTQLRNLPRHIESAWDALDAGHIQIHDPTNERYVTGMAMNVLAFQPMEGIDSEIILETIKPSIYFGDLLIQRADIIVARPLREAGVAASNANEMADVKEEDTKQCEAERTEPNGKDHD